MKTEIVLVEKGKQAEATKLLQQNGFTVFGPMRFRFDINTAVVTVLALAVIAIVAASIF